MTELRIDRARAKELPETGIYVRALNAAGKTVNADISQLDQASLLTWLRSRGGKNPWAEGVVFLLLGHQIPESLAEKIVND